MTASNPVDQPFRRLFAGFDRDVEPPADLATRLRLRVLAEAELDDPVARRPVPAPLQAPADAPITPLRSSPARLTPAPDPARPISVVPGPASRPDEVGARRRRQPWYLVAAAVAAVVLLLMGAAVVVIQRTIDPDRSAPRLGSSITAVAEPSADPQLLWERTDPDLQGTGDIAAGDDLLVRSVLDEHRSGFLWFEQYEYDSYLQALDRRTGELRWQVPVDAYGTTYVTAAAVLYVSYPNEVGTSSSLLALSHADGSRLWAVDLPAAPTYAADLTVRDDVLYLATSDAHVRALDLTTGAEVWATPIGDLPGEDTPQYVYAHDLTLDGDRLLTLDPAGAVVELDAATGDIATRHATSVSLPGVVYDSRLLVTPDRLVTVVTGTDREFLDDDYSVENQPPITTRVSAIDRLTGVAAWTDEYAGNTGVVSRADGRMVVQSYGAFDESMGGEPVTLRVVDLRSGDELWAQPQEQAGLQLVSPERATTGDGQLLLGTQAGEIVSLDIETGTELWRYDVGDHVMMPPVVTGALAIVGDRPDHLVAIDIPEKSTTE